MIAKLRMWLSGVISIPVGGAPNIGTARPRINARGQALEVRRFDAQRAGRRQHAPVVTRKPHRVAFSVEKYSGCKMQGIQRAHWHGERLQGATQGEHRQFGHVDLIEQCDNLLAIGPLWTCEGSVPNLVLQQSTGDQNLVPERRAGLSVLREELSENHRTVYVDHQRSSRSRSRSASSCSSV